MNDNDAILAELRKISGWADLQRKVTKWSIIAVAIFIPAMILIAFLVERQVTKRFDESAFTSDDWSSVDRDVWRGDFDSAIRTGEELVARTPHYPNAHRRLAGAYLAAGNLEKAKEHYAEAARLFPSEENEKLLAAILKRAKTEARE